MDELTHAAICVAGQLRSGACPAAGGALSPVESMRRHLVAPMTRLWRSVDVFAALDAPPRRGARQPGLSGPLLQRYLQVLSPVQLSLESEAGDEAEWQRARAAPFGSTPTGGNGTACGALEARFDRLLGGDNSRDPWRKGGGAAAWVQARRLQVCFEMVRRREEALGRSYSHVVRVRPDSMFSARLDLGLYFPQARHEARAASHWRAATESDDLCARCPATGPACYAPCRETSSSRGRGAAFDVLMVVPFAWPFETPSVDRGRKDRHRVAGQRAPRHFVNDHFYVASRRVARALFDHLGVVVEELAAPIARELESWQQTHEKHLRKHANIGSPRHAAHLTKEARHTRTAADERQEQQPTALLDLQTAPRRAFCERQAAVMDRAARPVLMPCPGAFSAGASSPAESLPRLPSDSHGSAGRACTSANSHECAIALSLSRFEETGCSLRIRYLRAEDSPLALRLRDTATPECDAARQAYACAERWQVAVPNKSALLYFDGAAAGAPGVNSTAKRTDKLSRKLACDGYVPSNFAG